MVSSDILQSSVKFQTKNKMQFLHSITLFFLLVMHYSNAQDVKVDEWLQATNCIPGAPVSLDFCTCKCSEVTAALRSAPDMQIILSRRMRQKRRRGMEDTAVTKSTIQEFTPGVIKCWETCVDSLIQ